MLIEHMKQGYSLESFGSLCKCSVNTLYNWLDQHPEFFQARKEGMSHLHKFYEDTGRALLGGKIPGGNVTAWIFLAKNMVGWRDKRDLEISGKEGGPINFANQSDEDLKTELKRLMEEAKKVI